MSELTDGSSSGAPAENVRRWLRRWLPRFFLVVGFALLVYAVSRYPLAEIVRACRRFGPWVALTPLVALGWVCCNASALYLLLDKRVPWRQVLRIRLVGDGYNALLPLAGMGGEPYRVKHLAAFVPMEQAVTGVIRDRILNNASGMFFTSLWLALAVGHFALGGSLRFAVIAYAGIAPVVGLAIMLLVLSTLPGRAAGVLARWLGARSQSVVTLPPAKLARVFAWYLAARAIGPLEFALLLWLLGLGFDPITILFCYSLHHPAGTVGFVFPGGVGLHEGVSVYLFSLLGFPGPAGVAFALARRGRMLVVGFLGVALHLWGLRSARRQADAEPLRPHRPVEAKDGVGASPRTAEAPATAGVEKVA
ncbi:MAG: flippase-like domain-containing protein [Deltaproteobacteria bacterium]|nr:flippase-like domain-containing protein [Deltaproteobacteria bacterium]